MDSDTRHRIGVNEGTIFKVMGLHIAIWGYIHGCVYRQGMERISSVGKFVNIDGYRHDLIIGITDKCGCTLIDGHSAIWIHADQFSLTAGISDWTGGRVNGKGRYVFLNCMWFFPNENNTTDSVAAIFVCDIASNIRNHSDVRWSERTDIVDIVNRERGLINAIL